MYNRTFRTVAASEGLTLVEQARLFAMLNLAGADALINCWNDKAHWSFWRPITAIREGDKDGNPKHDGGSKLDAAQRPLRRIRTIRRGTTAGRRVHAHGRGVLRRDGRRSSTSSDRRGRGPT